MDVDLCAQLCGSEGMTPARISVNMSNVLKRLADRRMSAFRSSLRVRILHAASDPIGVTISTTKLQGQMFLRQPLLLPILSLFNSLKGLSRI